MNDLLSIAIIGCGLIGNKRANQLPKSFKLKYCVDTDLEKAFHLAEKWDATPLSDYRQVAHSNVDAVIVSTPNHMLYPIAREMVQTGKHVLVEKPCGLDSNQIRDLSQTATAHDVVARAGFNHRYHPAMQKAFDLVNEGAIGRLMYVTGLYGHGGAYLEKGSWRTDPKLVGGGDLLEKGCHLIDLAGWFLLDGGFCDVNGIVSKAYWDFEIEDNAFLTLRTRKNNLTAFLHTSATEWRNTFRFSIYGTKGKLEIEGLGGSYGTEKLTEVYLKPEEIKPQLITEEFLGEERSWHKEMTNFYYDIVNHRFPTCGLGSALHCMEIVEKVYAQNGVVYDHRP